MRIQRVEVDCIRIQREFCSRRFHCSVPREHNDLGCARDRFHRFLTLAHLVLVSSRRLEPASSLGQLEE